MPASDGRTEVPYGTLDLLVLKTLESLGPLHGYGIARRIEQVSDHALQLNQGSIYPALLRLQQRDSIQSEWGKSSTGRRAKYYSLTEKGRTQLLAEVDTWRKTTELVAKVLAGAT